MELDADAKPAGVENATPVPLVVKQPLAGSLLVRQHRLGKHALVGALVVFTQCGDVVLLLLPVGEIPPRGHVEQVVPGFRLAVAHFLIVGLQEPVDAGVVVRLVIGVGAERGMLAAERLGRPIGEDPLVLSGLVLASALLNLRHVRASHNLSFGGRLAEGGRILLVRHQIGLAEQSERTSEVERRSHHSQSESVGEFLIGRDVQIAVRMDCVEFGFEKLPFFQRNLGCVTDVANLLRGCRNIEIGWER